MTRVVALAFLIVCVGLLAYDGQLVLTRFGANSVYPLNLWKIAAAIIIQLASLAFAVWYALLLAQRKHMSAHSGIATSLTVKLFPFVVPVVLSLASVTLLEIGLFCGDQQFPSVRGRSVCPSL
jgi:hypothetical protein